MKNDANKKDIMSVLRWINQERFKFAIVIVFLLILIIFLFLGKNIKSRKEDREHPNLYSDFHIGLEYDFGYDNLVKRGRFLPITVGYTNLEDKEFNGSISFQLSKEHSSKIESKYPVNLLSEERRSETYYIFLEYDSISLEIKLLDDKGKEIVSREENFEDSTYDSSLVIGVLSDDISKLEYFNNVSIDYGLLTTKLIDLSPYQFPDFERGLDQLDVVLISNYRIRDLDVVQSRALMNWVNDGGVLIMGTGQRVDDTLGRYAPELLENMYKSPEIRDVSLGTYKEEGNVVKEIVPIPIVDFNIHGGTIISSDGGVNLVSAVNRDNGLIAVATYDFCDLSDYARIHNSFVDDLMVRVLGSEKIYELAYDDGSLLDSSHRSDIDVLVEGGNDYKLPPIMWIIFTFTVYLMLISPLLFIFLKHFRLSHLYSYSVVVISLLFAYMIFALGNDTRVTGITYSYASIFDYSEDNIVERSFISLRNPYNSSYHFSLPKEYSILPFSNLIKSDSKNGKSNISIDHFSDRTDVNIGYIGGFQPVTMDLKQSIENVDGQGFSGELKFFNNKLTGEITNDFDFSVEDVTVLLYGKMIILGDFIAKETKDVEDATILNIPLNETDLIASMITGVKLFDEEQIYEEEYFTDRKRNDLLVYYINNYYTGYTVDAKVVGFTNRHIREDMIEPKDLKNFGVSLLTTSLAVDNRENDRIYRSTLMKSPKTISGEYYKEANMTYTFEPTVLEYDLGEDISIEEIHIQYLSDDLKYSSLTSAFKGDITILNVYNDNFDLLEPGKTVLDAEDLLDYISTDNHITIRYSHRLDSPNDNAVFLPMIYVMGVEY